MKRDWSNPLFTSELEDDETPAQALASVAEPRYIEGVQQVIASLSAHGEKACVATHRPKFDAEGTDVTGDDDAAGKFRTVAYEFATANEQFTVEAAPELYGTGASFMLASELALELTADILRSLLDVKVILDRLGGQVWIAPFVDGEQIMGFAFVWDHVSKLGRGKVPDPNIEEPLALALPSSNGTEPDGAD